MTAATPQQIADAALAADQEARAARARGNAQAAEHLDRVTARLAAQFNRKGN